MKNTHTHPRSQYLKLIFLLISFLGTSFLSFSNIPLVNAIPVDNPPLFYKTFGGNGDDRCYREWIDGSDIYTIGTTESFGEGLIDILLVKWNSQGEILMNLTWGTEGNDRGYSIWGNEEFIFVTGLTDGLGAGNEDLILVKFDKSGNELWNITWGGTEYEEGSYLWGSSSHLYCIGSTFSFGAGNEDLMLIKWDFDGNQINNITWGGSGDDWCAAMYGTNEFLYMAGYTNSFSAGDKDAVLLKFDFDLNVVWSTTWGDVGDDIGYSIWGNSSVFYVTGWTYSYDSYSIDIFVLKYDSEGILLWESLWGLYNNEYGYCITGDDLGIYVTGPIWSETNGLNDVFIGHWDFDGNYLWHYTWGSSGREWGTAIFLHESILYCLGVTNSIGNGGYDMLLLAWDRAIPWFQDIPEDLYKYEGYTDFSVQWVVVDSDPSTYFIELDGSLVVGPTPWVSGEILTYLISDGLLEGNYNITIMVSDESGNTAQDTAIFTVKGKGDPISIYWNSDLANLKAQGLITGDGTEEIPYLLKDLVIDAELSGSGIEIRYTNAYLIINNCTVLNSGPIEGVDAGIMIRSCSNIKIMNCTINNTDLAISLNDDSFNNIIINNTILHTRGFSGISTAGSDYNQILNNTMKYSNNAAMNLWDSENNFMSGNIMIDNYEGIAIENSRYNNVWENEVFGSTEGNGIALISSFENTISKNALLDGMDGIGLWGSENNIISDNIISECNGDGIYFTDSPNNQLINNTISDVGANGILLEDSPNNKILSNTVSNSGYDSIQVIRSNNVQISENSVSFSDYGICSRESNNVEISLNTIFQNNYGIYLISSHENTISANEISSNTYSGIYLVNSNYNSVFENTIIAGTYGDCIKDLGEDNDIHDNECSDPTTTDPTTTDPTTTDPTAADPIIGSYPWLSLLCVTGIATILEIHRKKRKRSHA
jgi:parallel beta-helix repeat protein